MAAPKYLKRNEHGAYFDTVVQRDPVSGDLHTGSGTAVVGGTLTVASLEALDLSTLETGEPVIGDFLLFVDQSDGKLKKVPVDAAAMTAMDWGD
jgi:hypothetical protein